MRILYFMRNIGSPPPGARQASKKILSAIAAENSDFQFVIVTNKSGEGNQTSKVTTDNHVVYAYNSPGLGFPGLNFLWENFLAEQLIQSVGRKTEPDIIHIQGYAGFYPRPYSGIPSLLTSHDFPPWRFPDRPSLEPSTFMNFLWHEEARRIRLKNLACFTHFHALSTQIEEFLKSRKITSERIIMVPNGINRSRPGNSKLEPLKRRIYRRKMGFSDDDILILMVGAVEYRKGIHLAKAALNWLPSNYHLLLVGWSSRLGGAYYLKKLLKGKDSSRIHYFGHVSKKQVEKILGLVDCYLSASLSEACQISVLEASEYGLPVVLTNIGAATDIFGPNYPFLVSNPDPELLASKIRLGIASGRNTPIPINNTTWNSVGKTIGKFYRTLTPSAR